MKKVKIHKDMMVDEIMQIFPEATELLMSYGLSCVGCYANTFESLEVGLLRHGYDEEEVQNIVSEINEYFNDIHGEVKKQKIPKEADNMQLTLTKVAQEKISEISKNQEKANKPLRVSAIKIGSEIKHSLDFTEESELSDEDKVFEFSKPKVRIVVSKRLFQEIDGLEIDFLSEEHRRGFKMNYPEKK